MKTFGFLSVLGFCLFWLSPQVNAQTEVFSGNDQKALEETQQIRKELLAGVDFAELARKYSDDPGSGPIGGELGYMQKGQLVPEYEEAALALSKGEISEPVKTKFGYHIIQLIAIEEDRFNTRHILIKP